MTSLMAHERRTFTHSYLGTPASVAIARRSAVHTVMGWGHQGDKVDDLGLIVSELVTNAVENARHGEIQLTISESCGHVAVEVRDESPDIPQKRTSSLMNEDGRGLWIVEALAVRCGVRWDHGRKVVFAVL